MQNSGQGNAVNPLASLADKKVYGIPMILVIGWRVEPGVADEPQHAKQGEITLSLLEVLGIPYFIIEKSTSQDEVLMFNEKHKAYFEEGGQIAYVVCKGAVDWKGRLADLYT